MKFSLKAIFRKVLDRPAIHIDGTRVWTVDGNPGSKLHRVGKPAIVRDDGSFEYWHNGVLHRIGGPAVFDGVEESHFLHGRQVSSRFSSPLFATGFCNAQLLGFA